MNITVANAGASGGPLNAKVVGGACSNSGGGGSNGCNAAPPAFTYTLTLDTAAAASANNTNITWRNGSQPIPIAPGTDFNLPLLNCGSASGCGWYSSTNSTAGTRGDGFGFQFSTDSPYLVINAQQDQFGVDHWTQINNANYSFLIRLINSNGAPGSAFQVFAATPGVAANTFSSFWTLAGQIDASGTLRSISNLAFANNLLLAASPTIAANGCGGAGATISQVNGTAAFLVNVGTGAGSACTITMPAAANNWGCPGPVDITTQDANHFLQKQSSNTITSVVIKNYATTGATSAFSDNDILSVSCFAHY
jgi:hypothetical protein